MHYSPEEIERIKTEQKKDFEFMSPWANKNCPVCHGLAYQGFDINELKLIPCMCLINNLQKEKEKEHVTDAEQGGMIKNIRQLFGMN